MNCSQNRKDITIAITAASYSGNKGAAAMLQSSIKQLHEHYGPGLTIKLMSVYPREDRVQKPFDFIEIVPAPPEKLLFIAFPLAVLYFLLGWIPPIGMLLRKNKIIGAYALTDAVIDEAGISFVDSRGVVMNTYAFVSILVPMLCGVPVVKYSQAMGPFHNFWNRIYAKLILPKVKLICARGEITLDNLKSIGLQNNVKLAADGAFSMPDDPAVYQQVQELTQADGAFYNGNVIALSISSVVDGKCRKKGIDYQGIMVQFIDYLTRSGYHVLLIANAARMGKEKPRNNDLIVCQAVYDRCADKEKVRWYYEEMTAEKIRELIGVSRFLVASRFHAMIGGLYKQVPVLLIGWSHKYKEVLDMFGLGECAIDFSRLSLDTLVKAFQDFAEKEPEMRTKLQENQQRVRSSSRDNIRFITQVLDGLALKKKHSLFDMADTTRYLGENLGCRMGYTTSEEIAANCSSGGLVSSVLCHMLETGEIDGAWVTKSVIENGQLKYQTFIATTKEEIIHAGSSVYMQIPLLKHISLVENFPGKVAVVMLPCQLRSLEKLMEKNPALREKIVLRLGLYCSGTHSKQATLLPIRKLGLSLEQGVRFFYRKGFWRGQSIIEYADGTQKRFSYTKSICAYKNAYFFSQKSCMLCQEHFAEHADLSFGDIWLKEMKKQDRKFTCCIIRTPAGEQAYQAAVRAGLVHDEPISRRKVVLSQKRALVFKFHCAKAKQDEYRKKGKQITLDTKEPCRWNYRLAWFLASKNQAFSTENPEKMEKIPMKAVYVYMLFIRFLLSF